MTLKTGYECVDKIQLAQDKGQEISVIYMVIKAYVLQVSIIS